MRINEYNSFEEFYEEYNHDRDVLNGHYIGLEFKYKEKYYRLSHDFSNSDQNNEYKYFAYEIIQDKNSSYFEGLHKLLGKYHNLDEALNEWIIDEKQFKEVIMLDETKILGKD